ncbi:MAG: ABC transporter ATP-binding protein [Bacilli bacterium]|nr:ABC transporter ATP-binding protein [Bacilli bacterium]
MIEISGLTKRFGDLRAVDNLTLAFRPGVTGLVGENGAGKSTLFRCIAGIYTNIEGSILVGGQPASDIEAKKSLFFLSDTPYFPHGASPKGIANFYKGIAPLNEGRFFELLNTFGLPLERGIGTYSKGMRRQLFIALALAMECEYLLMDEAFDGLDPLVVEKIKGEIIQAGEAGRTVVLSSHNIPVLERLADRFVLLHKGKLGKEGESEDIGTEFVKFQGVFKCALTAEMLEGLGFEVVSFKKVGSVSHFVLLDKEGIEERINKAYEPMFLERIPIDPDELLVLEMMLAEKGGKKNA